MTESIVALAFSVTVCALLIIWANRAARLAAQRAEELSDWDIYIYRLNKHAEDTWQAISAALIPACQEAVRAITQFAYALAKAMEDDA